jgi:hypothetical protein
LLLKAIARQSPAFRDGSADLPVTTMILRLMVVKRGLIGVPQAREGFGLFIDSPDASSRAPRSSRPPWQRENIDCR